VYTEANVIPPYPYLWQDGVQHGRGAQQQLEAFFAGANPPTVVDLVVTVMGFRYLGILRLIPSSALIGLPCSSR